MESSALCARTAEDSQQSVFPNLIDRHGHLLMTCAAPSSAAGPNAAATYPRREPGPISPLLARRTVRAALPRPNRQIATLRLQRSSQQLTFRGTGKISGSTSRLGPTSTWTSCLGRAQHLVDVDRMVSHLGN